ncbi:prepilin peptidase [Halomonadaceae bacterium KBTZ08]
MQNLIHTLLNTPWLFWPALVFVSLCVGSFLNVVILRLPRMMEQAWRQECQALFGEAGDSAATGEAESPYGIAYPQSHCPECGNTIRAIDNIPVISWLLLRGRCRHCNTRIPARYPVIEALTAVLSVLTVLILAPSQATLVTLPFLWALVALTVIDLETTLLPDSITLPLLWGGLVVSALGLGQVGLQAAFWGAVAGYLSLWSVYHLFRLLTGKEGMGHGDFKLLAALGAWLGWTMLPAIILLSSLVGAVVGIAMIAVRGHDRNIPIPFGPYLAAAGVIALWYGPELLDLWLATIRV